MNALAPRRAEQAEQLVLRLDGFEGPLDLLLDLARTQKVDLSRISILALVEQYLAVIEGARRIRIELAADWLVMAAWLACLKSRLLLPDEEVADEQIEDATERLAERLVGLERIRALAAWLDERPVLGRDVHRRGARESFIVTDRSGYRLDLSSLLGGYLAAVRRVAATGTWRPVKRRFWTVADALTRLECMLGLESGWTDLASLVPEEETDVLAGNAAMASTLLAALELAKRGAAELVQDAPFTPLRLRAVS